MALVREFDHHRRDLAKLERAKHLFPTRTSWSARILFAQDEHERRLHLVDVSDRRAGFEIAVFVVERRILRPVWLEKSEISRVPPVGPVRDIALRDRGGEPIGLP